MQFLLTISCKNNRIAWAATYQLHTLCRLAADRLGKRFKRDMRKGNDNLQNHFSGDWHVLYWANLSFSGKTFQ